MRRLLGATSRGEIIVWDTGTLKVVQRAKPFKKIIDADLNEDGTIALIMGHELGNYLWDVTQNQSYKLPHSKYLSRWSADKKRIISYNHSDNAQGPSEILVQSTDSNSLLGTLNFNGSTISSVSTSSDGKQIAVRTKDHKVQIWSQELEK
jgi:WD40 repeat protein